MAGELGLSTFRGYLRGYVSLNDCKIKKIKEPFLEIKSIGDKILGDKLSVYFVTCC